MHKKRKPIISFQRVRAGLSTAGTTCLTNSREWRAATRFHTNIIVTKPGTKGFPRLRVYSGHSDSPIDTMSCACEGGFHLLQSERVDADPWVERWSVPARPLLRGTVWKSH